MLSDKDIKRLIPDIDFINHKKVFKTWSITRYIKLIEKAKEKEIYFNDFDSINNFFIEDIRLKRILLKYLFYIENKLGAELVSYLIIEKEDVKNIIKKCEFIQIPNNYNDKLEKFSKSLRNFEFKELYELPDKLSFSKKIKLMKLLNFYFKHEKLKKKFWTIFTNDDLFKFAELRNKIVHHNFIILEQNEINEFIKKIIFYIDEEYINEYNKAVNEINNIWKKLKLNI
ncbi:MAG: hypothetical protein ACRCRP_01360 [Metamycoplasmataceae bacterium]